MPLCDWSPTGYHPDCSCKDCRERQQTAVQAKAPAQSDSALVRKTVAFLSGVVACSGESSRVPGPDSATSKHVLFRGCAT